MEETKDVSRKESPSAEPSIAKVNDTTYLTQENMNEVWKRVLLSASKKIDELSFFVWLKPTSATLENETIVVHAKNQFQADWLIAKYHRLIQEVLEDVTGERDLKIEYVVS